MCNGSPPPSPPLSLPPPLCVTPEQLVYSVHSSTWHPVPTPHWLTPSLTPPFTITHKKPPTLTSSCHCLMSRSMPVTLHIRNTPPLTHALSTKIAQNGCSGTNRRSYSHFKRRQRHKTNFLHGICFRRHMATLQRV